MSELKRIAVLCVLVVMSSCIFRSNIISSISIDNYHGNELKIKIDVVTDRDARVRIDYWPDSVGNTHKSSTPLSSIGQSHSLILCDVIPDTHYTYQIITDEDGAQKTSKLYSFQSRKLPVWLTDQFKYSCKDTTLLPYEFKNGLMLLNKRETPGLVFLADYKGKIRWYHMIEGMGFKVSHFTDDQTIISILGKNDEPTSYGSNILELNLLGDTLLYLKKGEGDLKNTIHHEIIKNKSNELVTLFVDERITDLHSVGGTKRDTVKGDGIIIFDRHGKKQWQWSVFDDLDPLKDKNILKNKKDWMHANSLSYDSDGNFLISFYNNGQIWKVDAQSGKVIWKYGKGGSLAVSHDCIFSEAHAVHMNQQGNLMFFDNGVARKQSSVFVIKVNKDGKSAQLGMHVDLPKEIYNERMGSAYMITDSTMLICCSKRHITVVANTKGSLLWTLESAFPSYRTQLVSSEKLKPFFIND